jgi:hypothetical protein
MRAPQGRQAAFLAAGRAEAAIIVYNPPLLHDARMTDRLAGPSARVIAVKMGYGHQRTAHPLRSLAPGGEVLLADDYPGMPESDRAIWQRMQRFYEFASNARQVPVVGQAAFAAFDILQKILRFYPKRDLSRPDWNVRVLYSLLRQGWGRHFVDGLKADTPALPIVTSFFTPAFMAEFCDYPGDIYCIVCDADIARAWASIHPSSSRIKYFAPTRRAADRLHLYGVRPENVFLTGYPLPMENIGGEDLAILKEDLAQRIVNLDPEGRYVERYGSLIAEKVGDLPPGPTRPLTILFSIGGAGAQKEIAADLLRSLKKRIANDEVRLVVSTGIKPWVRDYVEHAVEECGLAAEVEGAGPEIGGRAGDTGVRILFAETMSEYFQQFSRALRTTDVLWTKPSELSFYSALGLPIILAPPLGAQEKANREWLLRLGAGTLQDDPADADEWFFDLLETGWFAEAAMEGFVEGETLASRAIAAILRQAAAISQAAAGEFARP